MTIKNKKVDVVAERFLGSAITCISFAMVLVIVIGSLFYSDISNNGEKLCKDLGYTEFNTGSFECQEITIKIIKGREYVKEETLQLSFKEIR